MKLKVKKQSLIDWCVEDENGKTFAWISKSKGIGYNVRFVWDATNFQYFCPNFKEAKRFAMDNP